MLKIVLLTGNQRVHLLAERALPVAIGRGRACHVRLDDPACSRRHALLRLAHGELEIHDLGSANGVRVNGARIRERSRLFPGDRVEVGASAFTVERTEEAPPISPSRLPIVVAAALFVSLVAGYAFFRKAFRERWHEPPASGPERRTLEPEQRTPEERRDPDPEREKHLAECLAAVEREVAEGRFAAARGRLLSFLDWAGPNASWTEPVRERMHRLDLQIEEHHEREMAEAAAREVEGDYAVSRRILEGLARNLSGLPWEVYVERRLSRLDAAEAAAREAEAARARAEAEATAGAEAREAARASWRADQQALATLVSTMNPRRRAERTALAERIAAVDPAVEEPLAGRLIREQSRLAGRLRARLKPDRFETFGAQLLSELEVRRKDALDLILDEVRYPYFLDRPDRYGPDGAKVQKEVDRLVAAVEAVWKRGEIQTALLKRDDQTGEVVEKLEELETLMRTFGLEVAQGESCREIVTSFQVAAQIEREAEVRRAHQAVLDENEKEFAAMKGEGLLDDEEMACIRITNDYRIMMGLAPLRVDRRLSDASRKHSADMARRGYFSHTNPDGHGPEQRARAAGFMDPCGENIHQGSDRGEWAFLGWRGSSGHHRNMLKKEWNRIGVGRSGVHWTMMPGTG